MEKPFFIMLYNQDLESATPMFEYDEFENEQVVFFETYDAAEIEAQISIKAQSFGYKIFNMEGE